MIVFRNKGLIDTKFITTFGVSAKEGENPVGFFGTGLKYAIAICLRENQDIEIDIGGVTHHFCKREETLRNKDFEFIDMFVNHNMPGQDEEIIGGVSRVELPFTTELGKKWQLWQAFRELYCNCTDEGGEIFWTRGDDVPWAQEDETVIRVSGEAIDQCFRDKGMYILDKAPIFSHFMAEVAEGPSKALYLRSIRAQELKRPSLMTYNVLFQAELTEDRTIKYDFETKNAVAVALSHCTDEEILKRVLLAPEGFYEQELDFSNASGDSCKVFLDLVGALRKKHFGQINKTALRAYEKQRKKLLCEEDLVKLTPLEDKMLARAKDFCREQLRCDALDDYPILVVDLDEGTLGLAMKDKIFLNKKCFRMGTKMVASTLYEEYLHVHRGLRDCDREMQNFLMDTIASMAEEMKGEPL